jgi:hypothetical protein
MFVDIHVVDLWDACGVRVCINPGVDDDSILHSPPTTYATTNVAFHTARTIRGSDGGIHVVVAPPVSKIETPFPMIFHTRRRQCLLSRRKHPSRCHVQRTGRNHRLPPLYLEHFFFREANTSKINHGGTLVVLVGKEHHPGNGWSKAVLDARPCASCGSRWNVRFTSKEPPGDPIGGTSFHGNVAIPTETPQNPARTVCTGTIRNPVWWYSYT